MVLAEIQVEATFGSTSGVALLGQYLVMGYLFMGVPKAEEKRITVPNGNLPFRLGPN